MEESSSYPQCGNTTHLTFKFGIWADEMCFEVVHAAILGYLVQQLNTIESQTLGADTIVWDLADTP